MLTYQDVYQQVINMADPDDGLERGDAERELEKLLATSLCTSTQADALRTELAAAFNVRLKERFK